MAKRIVLTGGGTGGHLYPLISVAEYIRQNTSEENSAEFLFLGPNGKIEREIMQQHSIPQKTVISGKMRRYFSLRYFLDLLKIPAGLIQSAWYLFWFMPDVVYAKGGYASVPVVIMAKLYRVPILIHESDALPGMANKLLGSLATRVAINFEKANIYFPPSRTFISGIPVKAEALSGDAEKARETLNLPYIQKPVVLFVGGSQGAKAINDQVIENIVELLSRYQVIHVTGKAHYDAVCYLLKEKGIDLQSSDYRPIAYVGEELRDMIAMADVIVSRAGATTIAEIAANQKASILIPIANSANGHQRVNAYEIAKYGATIVLEEDNFKRGMLLYNLQEILTDEKLKTTLSQNIAQFYHPDANRIIAEEIMKLAV